MMTATEYCRSQGALPSEEQMRFETYAHALHLYIEGLVDRETMNRAFERWWAAAWESGSVA